MQNSFCNGVFYLGQVCYNGSSFHPDWRSSGTWWTWKMKQKTVKSWRCTEHRNLQNTLQTTVKQWRVLSIIQGNIITNIKQIFLWWRKLVPHSGLSWRSPYFWLKMICLFLYRLQFCASYGWWKKKTVYPNGPVLNYGCLLVCTCWESINIG